MKPLLPQNLAHFLKRVGDYMQSPFTAAPEEKRSGKRRAPASRKQSPPVRPASATDAVPSSATIRIQCIKIFREEGALTLQECSDVLNLPVCLLKPQFQELRQLGILEQGGTRLTSAGNQGVYRLNESHPTLDFVFGARPEGMTSPRELLTRNRAAQMRWEGPEAR